MRYRHGNDADGEDHGEDFKTEKFEPNRVDLKSSAISSLNNFSSFFQWKVCRESTALLEITERYSRQVQTCPKLEFGARDCHFGLYHERVIRIKGKASVFCQRLPRRTV